MIGTQSMRGRRRADRPCRVRVLLLVLAVAGCAAYDPPRAWEKDILAREAMQFDADALAARLGRQVYTSKEAASGGHGVGGGGCGCN